MQITPVRIKATPEWQALVEHHHRLAHTQLRDLFAEDSKRGETLTLDAADLHLDYSKNRLTSETIDLLVGRKKLSSAGSGGRPATTAMLDFCAEHGITADIELLPSARVNEALERLGRNDVRYRFVLDMSDLAA